ncbi:MAG: hypothetical protein AB7S36_01165 [Planctomycetota bacterium]
MNSLSIDKFCKLVASLGFLVLALAAMVFAINAAPTANAQDPKPQPAVPAASGAGVYMMSLTYNDEDKEMDLEVWNTVTGQSKCYWYSDDGEWKLWSGQLPQKPLD